MNNRILLFMLAALIATGMPAAGGILPTPDALIEAIVGYSYPADMRAARYLTFRNGNLDSLSGMPLEAYVNLEAVIIELTENPDSPDSVKEKIITSVEQKLHVLSHLRKCPRLKYVILHAGEYVFIRAKDGIPYDNGNPSLREKADRLNIERLDARFGKRLAQLLPGIKLYAHNWSW